MTWRLDARVETARMRLPDGRSVERRVEIRTHPLTGETVRVLTPPFRRLRVPDIRAEYAHTRNGCPFCPEAVETQTPAFHPYEFPEPRIAKGQVTVFPNLLAYAGISAVSVLTREHFVALFDFTPDLLTDAFDAARAFFHAARTSRPDLTVRLLHWNYMPPSGSSMIHPHHQLMATRVAPTRLARLADGSRRLASSLTLHPWEAILEAERSDGGRWVGETDRWCWTTDPAPQGRYFELVGIHASACDLADLGERDFEGLVDGLLRTFRYLDRCGLWSFNLALMGLPAEASGHFRVQVRLVPRAFFPPAGCSDIHFDVIEHEPMVLRSPEQSAEELREFFG